MSKELDAMLEKCREFLPEVYEDMKWALCWNAVSEHELIQHMTNKLQEVRERV